jgi:hypothetical protein
MNNIKPAIGGIALLLVALGGKTYAQSPSSPNPPLTPGPDDKTPAACPAPPAECPAPTPVATAPAPVEAPPPVHEAPPPVHEEQEWYDRIGIGLSAGGGVDDFANSGMRDTTGTGGSWNLRLTLGTREYIALEGLYIGSAQTINSLGLNNSTTLYGNGAQADLRLNATTTYPIQPFIYGGAAWRYYSLSHNSNTADIADNTNVFEIPAGVGIAGKYEGLMLDARGEYRWAWGDMVSNGSGGHFNMDRWGVTGNIGVEF